VHVPPWQIAAPCGSVGHFLHGKPQALASSSAAHESSHWWYPEPQVNVQVPPEVQPLLDAPFGLGQEVHRVPQEFGLSSEEQIPLQLWEPEGHCELQAALASMQLLLHNFCVPGQLPPHTPATHVAEPPVMDGQAVQELPQLAGSESLRHLPAPAQ
jgi:hypothetical protein